MQARLKRQAAAPVRSAAPGAEELFQSAGCAACHRIAGTSGQRPCRARPDARRLPADSRRGHIAEQSRHDDGLDRQQPGAQAEQPDAAYTMLSGEELTAGGLSRGAKVKLRNRFRHGSLQALSDTGRPARRRGRGAGADLGGAQGLGVPDRRQQQLRRHLLRRRGLPVLSSRRGAGAGLMRAQLALPLRGSCPQEIYNQFFTMHGTVMMFLFAVPMMEALGDAAAAADAGRARPAFPATLGLRLLGLFHRRALLLRLALLRLWRPTAAGSCTRR
jgi:hypothetical protein